MKPNGGGITAMGHAVPLEGAAKNPLDTWGGKNPDPTSGNVAPTFANAQMLDDVHGYRGDHFGLLEVNLRTDGSLEDWPGYGMHLDNVGPKVREKLRTLGTVRDLRVNKVVRVVSGHESRPEVIGAFMITADGYVRLTSWGVLPSSKVVPYAEQAQSLSLQRMEA